MHGIDNGSLSTLSMLRYGCAIEKWMAESLPLLTVDGPAGADLEAVVADVCALVGASGLLGGSLKHHRAT